MPQLFFNVHKTGNVCATYKVCCNKKNNGDRNMAAAATAKAKRSLELTETAVCVGPSPCFCLCNSMGVWAVTSGLFQLLFGDTGVRKGVELLVHVEDQLRC